MRFSILIGIGLLLAACGGGPQDAKVEGVYENIDVAKFSEKMKQEGVQLLDVRTFDEIKLGKIAGAKEMDFFDADFEKQLGTLDKNKPVLVYCAAGKRAGKAMGMMEDQGFKEVYNLEGGFGEWMSQNMPIEK
ncbi:MAG: rhodanese-like domain-containing protein [Flavobacteriales bacterium]|nr:rhodanese-like domain-containing protein [Flavobacteriales bacterium]